MAKIKKTLKENRVFLNGYDKSCTDSLFWRVDVYTAHSKKDSHEAVWNAEISLPQKTMLWAHKKGELRPLQTIQRELNKFNDAIEDAQQRVEEHNGKS